MKPTLLIDLDDTLLDNNIDTFLPAYLRALSKELAPYADPDRLVKNLLFSTATMIQNLRPDCTLQQVFEASFYPALGLNPDKVRAPIERFYADVFPTLQQLTRPRPEAIRMIDKAFEQGWQVVVATNPLFPRAAILHRLAWAGLPADRYPFRLITSYERFHFTKPHPAYYAEILGLLGWPQGPVVSVGNDLQNDIEPSRRLGLPAFWITSNGAAADMNGPAAPSSQGDLTRLAEWLERITTESPQPDYTQPASMLATLRSTPAVLHTLCESLDSDTWARRPKPGEWSVCEVLCHLRDVEKEVNLPRLQKVLRESNPFLPGMDTDPWAAQREYICQNGPEAWHLYTTARMELLDLLENLKPEDWQRSARHAIFGPTQLSELVSIIAAHDRLHIQQVQQALAAKSTF
ncbi:MAG TPA: DinB family protein [Anaerolineales bacterium]